jgi:ectoine hydroxylase-related dioxygenase (phytanoyl-CoA dioxygenase family)
MPLDFPLLGYAVIPSVLEPGEVARLVAALDRAGPLEAVLRRKDAVHGMRDLLRAIPEVRALAASAPLFRLVTPVLGPQAFAVRALLFDKTELANWAVPWHQDLTIAVATRKEAEGYGLWGMKAGIPHVRPPVGVLERMLTVRIHLDDCDEGRGPLRVLAGSHRGGMLDEVATRGWVEQAAAVECLVPRGGAVLMRPLLLHASGRASQPGRRRVLHLEYAADALPGGLDWFERVGWGES